MSKNIIVLVLLLFMYISGASADVYSDLSIYKKSDKPQSHKKVIKARSLGHDSRFKIFPFMDNGVYEVIALFDNTTYIEFEEDEVVTSVTNPKDKFWQLLPQKNKLFFKPAATGADTQMTVMTNKRIYFFEMYAREPDDNFDSDYTFYYQFTYPSDDENKTIRRYSQSILPNIDTNPEKYNFNYTITGHSSLYPLKIFDDGEFTYFEFKEKGGIVPAIFVVDSGSYESLVNFRMVGSYLVVETVSSRFTLRNGIDVVCVYNENMYERKEVKKSFFARIVEK